MLLPFPKLKPPVEEGVNTADFIVHGFSRIGKTTPSSSGQAKSIFPSSVLISPPSTRRSNLRISPFEAYPRTIPPAPSAFNRPLTVIDTLPNLEPPGTVRVALFITATEGIFSPSSTKVHSDITTVEAISIAPAPRSFICDKLTSIATTSFAPSITTISFGIATRVSSIVRIAPFPTTYAVSASPGRLPFSHLSESFQLPTPAYIYDNKYFVLPFAISAGHASHISPSKFTFISTLPSTSILEISYSTPY